MFALVRHGAHSGYPDHLTEAGREAVRALAERLAIAHPWTALRSSPRLRAQETAAIIAKVLGLSIVIDEALLENGDTNYWMPPHHTHSTILVKHAPTIRRIASRWIQTLGLPDYQPLDVSTALLIDPERRDIKLLRAD